MTPNAHGECTFGELDSPSNRLAMLPAYARPAIGRILVGLASACVAPLAVLANEPTRAEQSIYNQDIRKATTSEGLTSADLAWHAVNTYGWDCSEVTSKGESTQDGYYVISCSSGIQLRVYPRQGEHPRITNIRGGYD